MDAVIARRVITDVVVVAEKADCPKGYIVVPTKQSLNDSAVNESSFEIKSGLRGSSRQQRYICMAYGLEDLDEEVLTDLKILGTYEKVPAPREYTLLHKTRDTDEDALQDKQMYLHWKKIRGYEWVIDTLVICPSTVSQGKRRREDSGSYIRIGKISDSMALYCKKKFIYQASKAMSCTEACTMPAEEPIASECPTDKDPMRHDTFLSDKMMTEHTAGKIDCQTTLPKDEARNVYHSFSDPTDDTRHDEPDETKWQEIRRRSKKERRVLKSSSDSVLTIFGVKEEGKGKSRKKEEKKKGPEQSSCSVETTISQKKPTEDSISMLSISESPMQVTRCTIIKAPPLPRGKTYHVFFSFRNSRNDKDWVRGIIEKLESPPHCYSCCFADRDFIPGETIINNIEMAVKQSVRVAVVLTKEYIESYWCKYETNVIREPGSKACIIPLQLINCIIPPALKDLSFIPVSKDNNRWWETLLRALKGKIPYLPHTKSDHIFLFHGSLKKDVERIENLRSALETCACSFRCISSGRDFVYGSTVRDNVHMCAKKATITVFALSRNFPKEKWLHHWQELSQKGFKLFPLMFDHFDIPEELQDIVIFDATSEQNIWLPRLIDNLIIE